MAHLYLTHAPGPFGAGHSLSLVGDEAHHASKVARIQKGEKILVSDGQGHLAEAAVTGVSGSEVSLEVFDSRFVPKPTPEVWLAQALAKGDRDESAIQMACELGVDGVIPYAASRSVSVWAGDKKHKGQQRWQKIVQEASKQSLRAWIPEVKDICSTEDLISQWGDWNIVVMDPDATVPLSSFKAEANTPIVMVVGPEGGLSRQELNMFEQAGAPAYRLGDTVLRTSSAGPAALAVLNVRLGRW